MNGGFTCRKYSRRLQFITSVCWKLKGCCSSVKIKRRFTRIIRLSIHLWILTAVYAPEECWNSCTNYLDKTKYWNGVPTWICLEAVT
jgi:hypothetical protein